MMLRKLSAENVFVFVADSLRDDYLPQAVADMGVRVTTVASSLSSPVSFSSIATGLNPCRHNVRKWGDRLCVETIFDRAEINTSFWDDTRTLHAVFRDPPAVSLSEIEPPFFYMERDLLTHMPYNRDPQGTKHYFRHRGTNVRQLKADYRAAAQESLAKFTRRVDLLAKRGLLEKTLIVFTSDHGELLGEYGLVGHNSPACPELIYVPAVWIHPDLPRGERRDGAVMSHVDILPTALSAMGRDADLEMDGYNLLTHAGRQVAYCEKRSRYYTVATLWDVDGGRVFVRNGHVSGLAYAIARTMAPDWSCIRFAFASAGFFPRILRRFLRREQVFGNPTFSREEARRITNELERQEQYDVTTVDLDDEVVQQLERLGYLDS